MCLQSAMHFIEGMIHCACVPTYSRHLSCMYSRNLWVSVGMRTVIVWWTNGNRSKICKKKYMAHCSDDYCFLFLSRPAGGVCPIAEGLLYDF